MSTPFSRIMSLGRAEFRQLLRNRTLMGMMLLPLAPVLMLYKTNADDPSAGAAASTDLLIQFVLLFGVYYPVLSITAARRDEKVLKRLRVGELTDPDILVSLSAPAILSSLTVIALGAAGLLLLGSPLPDHPGPVVVAVVLGIPLVWGMALLTSIVTPTAEAAQMTSMPVMILIMLSAGFTRVLFPETLSEAIGYTPFAAGSDLLHLGWGESIMQSEGFLRPVLVLSAWTLLCCWAAVRYMKWENDR
ncbi:ABC transporter permease [Corynebacterium oculi]|uniref:ABC-2 family transporter protein n=1 Tax=Corynebacterium oculi TaxID=1544416 RepID=A0A0Q0Z2C5_9CORY|nr:ABC transporter permease [Corynebacterium oculi]KQB83324.1 ABC-2 family transporter protein [Corynebacterium oculi]